MHFLYSDASVTWHIANMGIDGRWGGDGSVSKGKSGK